MDVVARWVGGFVGRADGCICQWKKYRKGNAGARASLTS